MTSRAIMLLSGGLDSSVALMMARAEYDFAVALTFDYGQRAAPREIEAARTLCARHAILHEVIELPWLRRITTTSLVNRQSSVPPATIETLDETHAAHERMRGVWVPNRNGLFANVAACYAEAREAPIIIVGFNAEEAVTFSDNSAACAQALTEAFAYSTQIHPTVVSPTMPMRKEEIARVAVREGLTAFWSCYFGGDKMCGICESCLRTVRAFRAADAFNLIAARFECFPG